MTTIEAPQLTNENALPIGHPSAAAQSPRTPRGDATPNGLPASGDTNSTVSHCRLDTHTPGADGGPDSAADHACSDTQKRGVGSGPHSRQAKRSANSIPTPPAESSFPSGQSWPGTRNAGVGGEPNSGRPATAGTPRKTSLADPTLALAADVLDDLETVRIANENRLRQLTRSVEDSDGELRGFGLMPIGVCEPDDKDLVEKLLSVAKNHVDQARIDGKRITCPFGWNESVWRLALILLSIQAAEHDAIKNLERLMKAHPLGPWIKAQRGIGEKQGARLLAAIGDPYWNTLYDRPRTVSELWAYCGYHVLPAGQAARDTQESDASRGQAGVAPRRQRGAKANWSDTARKRAWLVAKSIVKSGGPYREIYDATKAKYADAVHVAPCVRCGPAGKPAAISSPLSKGHIDARGLRAISKAVLKELWRESKRLHEE